MSRVRKHVVEALHTMRAQVVHSEQARASLAVYALTNPSFAPSWISSAPRPAHCPWCGVGCAPRRFCDQHSTFAKAQLLVLRWAHNRADPPRFTTLVALCAVHEMEHLCASYYRGPR